MALLGAVGSGDFFSPVGDRGAPPRHLCGLRNVYPEADERRCRNHRILNVLDKLPKKRRAAALEMLRKLPCADTVKGGQKAKAGFQRWCREKGFDRAARVLDEDWDRMIAVYRLPKALWKHLRPSNPVESPFAALRLHTTPPRVARKQRTPPP